MGVSDTGKIDHFVEEDRRQNKVDSSPLPFIIKLSLDGLITYITRNAEVIIGYEPEELIGTHIREIMHQDDYKRIENEYNNYKEEIRKFSYRMKKKDGNNLWVENTTTFMNDSHDHVEKEIICIIYVSDRVEAENIIVESEKLKVAGQLAAGIAHEIKNPLTSLKGFIQLMKAEDIPTKKYLEIMEDEIHRLDVISNELLVLAKPHKNRVDVDNLTRIVEEVIFLLEAEAMKKSIQIVSIVDEEDLLILCDMHKVKQVLINIVKNAIESMEKSGVITIQVSAYENDAQVSVTDQGCGIPDEYLDQIGKPFFSTKETGNGLGLMICQKIISEHGGEMVVKTASGEGTTFTIQLPLVKS
ncbi:PAS domain S-box protein [Bacillus sp. V3B]|uniref:ATP-binding protein n=1 Tax=Bacillus sp. V3B TaxID=2804915 RepID=UPI00210CA35F|nr:ATP-binding protein [Bacillus sp. V3B]MCQ6273376.1 PAS domain S-box protein [Bacillus sp. V3B]